jgi:hypothetical protein
LGDPPPDQDGRVFALVASCVPIGVLASSVVLAFWPAAKLRAALDPSVVPLVAVACTALTCATTFGWRWHKIGDALAKIVCVIAAIVTAVCGGIVLAKVLAGGATGAHGGTLGSRWLLWVVGAVAAVAVCAVLWVIRKTNQRPWAIVVAVAGVAAVALLVFAGHTSPALSVVAPRREDLVGRHVSVTVQYGHLGPYAHVYVVVMEPYGNLYWIHTQDIGGHRATEATVHGVRVGTAEDGKEQSFTVFAIATKEPPTEFEAITADALPYDALLSPPIRLLRQ